MSLSLRTRYYYHLNTLIAVRTQLTRLLLKCLLFCMSQSFCAHAILIAIQRRDVRRTYNIKGSSIGDCCKSCCCPCCSLIQSEKETGESRPGFGGDGSVIDEQYKAETARMVMKTKTLPAPVQRGPPSGQTGSQEPEPKGEEVRAAPAPKQNEKVKEESGQSQPTLQPVTTHTTPTQLIREAQLALSLAQEQIQD
jgi:Cys-rich protein (TIGR01571 family)